MNKDFELMPHTADIKIRVYGNTLAGLFKHAVIGMFQSIGPRASMCTIKNDRLVCPTLPQIREIEISASSLENLLVDFLSEALYLSDAHNEAYLDAIIHEITDYQVKATLFGIMVDSFEVVEIKAVTYHDLKIIKKDHGWQTDIVFDI